MARAIERELADPSYRADTVPPARFPIFTATSPDSPPVTAADVRRDELDEDIRLSGRGR